MDYLERIVLKHKKELMTDEHALALLRMYDNRYNTTSDMRLLDHDLTVDSPEEMIVEKEKIEEQYQLIRELFSSLTDLERKVLWYNLGEEMSIRKVSALISVPKSTVQDAVKSGLDKISKLNIKINPDDIFYRKINIDASCHQSMPGYPTDLLRKVNIGGRWRNHHNKKVWVSYSKCMIKNFLKESFGDSETICNICSECKNGE